MIDTSKAKTLVSDADIALYHWGNFGDATPREIINEGVVNVGFGYSTGSTVRHILTAHKLITAPSSLGYVRLTAKGKRYLQAIFPTLPKPHKDFDQ
jgi:hypothetical protein